MNEQLNGRDMGRPHIQRSVGAVVAREVCAAFFEEQRAGMDSIDTDKIIEWSMRQMDAHSTGAVLAIAQTLSLAIFYPVRGELPFQSRHADEIDTIFFDNSFSTSMPEAMREGLLAQAHFPLNLARDISAAAAEKGKTGFETGTLMEIASVVRRPDFREMVDEASLTANGVWGGYSTSFEKLHRFGRMDDADRLGFDIAAPAGLEFIFTAGGSVQFAPEIRAYLRERLRVVNKAGITYDPHEGGIDAAPSSGCPARHLRAHFTKNSSDKHNLALLEDLFGKPSEAVLQPYDQSVIEAGLDLLADALEANHRKIGKARLAAHQMRAKAKNYIAILSAHINEYPH